MDSRRGKARRRTVLGTVLAAALVVTACAGDEPTDEPETPSTEAPDDSGEESDDTGDDGGDGEGSADEMDELIAAAQEEGEVLIYTAPGEATIEAWTEPFTEEFGIDVITSGGNSREVHQTWAQETQAGQHFADVVIHSLPLLFMEADEQGWVADYVPSESGSYPEGAKVEGKIYPAFSALNTFAWNAEQITDEERDMLMEDGMDALRDPIWQGRMAVVAADAGGSQLAEYHHVINVLGDEYGWDYMEDLAAQDPVIYDSTVPMGQALVAGEFAVAFALGTTVTASPILEGAPVEWRYRDNPSAGAFFQVVSEEAPNPNAARLFMDWATSLEGQTTLMNINSGISTHADWVDERPIAELDWYEPFSGEVYVEYAFDAELADAATEDLYPRWNELFGRE